MPRALREGDPVVNKWNTHCGIGEVLNIIWNRSRTLKKAIVDWPAYGSCGVHRLDDLEIVHKQTELPLEEAEFAEEKDKATEEDELKIARDLG